MRVQRCQAGKRWKAEGQVPSGAFPSSFMSALNRPGSRHIEKEFGVPIPGEILDSAQWVKTALKKVPAGVIDFAALFGRQAPLVLDLGCGNGRFSIASALTHPTTTTWRSIFFPSSFATPPAAETSAACPTCGLP